MPIGTAYSRLKFSTAFGRFSGISSSPPSRGGCLGDLPAALRLQYRGASLGSLPGSLADLRPHRRRVGFLDLSGRDFGDMHGARHRIRRPPFTLQPVRHSHPLNRRTTSRRTPLRGAPRRRASRTAGPQFPLRSYRKSERTCQCFGAPSTRNRERSNVGPPAQHTGKLRAGRKGKLRHYHPAESVAVATTRGGAGSWQEGKHPVGRRVNPLRGSSTAFRPSRCPAVRRGGGCSCGRKPACGPRTDRTDPVPEPARRTGSTRWRRPGIFFTFFSRGTCRVARDRRGRTGL